eukprot:TRINITY_DN7864_c0_g2_i3.p1 TRINITY_DN7864_c0_g2~~TRINITY_DN7864_c0_g2_i3.p1  ORF type:complete len:580 (-),score=181.21 TRINITY_DN7864_c0_g2_i3:153-1892(-)
MCERQRGSELRRRVEEEVKMAASAEEEAEGHKRAVAELQGDLAECREARAAEVATLQDRVRETQRHLDAAAEREAASSADATAAREHGCKRERELEDSVANLRQSAAEAAARLEAAETSAACLREQAEEAAEDADAAQKQLEVMTGRLDAECAERVRHGARAEALEAELQETRSGLEKARRACEVAEERARGLDESLQRCRAEAAQTQEALQSEVDRLAAAGAAAVEARRDGERRLRETERALEEAREALANVREEARRVRAEQSARAAEEDGEPERLRTQNRELGLTTQQLRQDCEALRTENRSLRESLALFEEDLERVSGRHAELLGHSNQKQKIRYTLKLKDEKNELRAELDRARARIAQLESRGPRRSEGLFDALAHLGYGGGGGSVAESFGGPRDAHSPPPPGGPRTPARRSAAATATTPSARTPRRPAMSSASAGPGMQDPDADDAGGVATAATASLALARAEAAERRGRMQERTLERLHGDFAHLLLLVERALCSDSGASSTASKGTHAIGIAVGDATTKTNFAGLLQRLRDIAPRPQPTAVAEAAGGPADAAPATAEAAASPDVSAEAVDA